jgi:hypothetical protein
MGVNAGDTDPFRNNWTAPQNDLPNVPVPAFRPEQTAALSSTFGAGDAKIIYVSPNGNNTNSGLVSSKAKLTLAGALTTMGAGTLGRIVMGAGVPLPSRLLR